MSDFLEEAQSLQVKFIIPNNQISSASYSLTVHGDPVPMANETTGSPAWKRGEKVSL